ncbi:MAG TPA: FAD-dependent oxidoreductase [Gaiellaceae bacterium]|nr:FAD-dependent oxidoreductase [Gaiellaceae bacterium]
MRGDTPEVLVVGGGAIGAAVALELARRGARPVLVERGSELAAGCSAGNAGLICPSHSAPLATPSALRQGLRWMLTPDSPFHLRPSPALVPWLLRFAAASTERRAAASGRLIRELSQASLELHAGLAGEGLDTGFERRGVLNVYESEAGFAAGRNEAEASEAAGMRPRILAGGAARELEPALGRELAGAVLYPTEAHCDPLRFVHAVGRAAARAGAEIRTGVEVLALRRRDGRVVAVETSAGELRPGSVVLAAGSWTPRLGRDLGVFVPVQGGKGYHVDVAPAPGDPRIPVFMQESRVIATPLDGRLRLAGTFELAGLDLGIKARRTDAIVAAARRVLPRLGVPRVLELWCGLRPCAPDGLPLIGRPAGLENLVLATGHAMMGLTLAPITGRLVADLLAGEAPGHDVAALRPDRFRPLLRGLAASRPRQSRAAPPARA